MQLLRNLRSKSKGGSSQSYCVRTGEFVCGQRVDYILMLLDRKSRFVCSEPLTKPVCRPWRYLVMKTDLPHIATRLFVAKVLNIGSNHVVCYRPTKLTRFADSNLLIRSDGAVDWTRGPVHSCRRLSGH